MAFYYAGFKPVIPLGSLDGERRLTRSGDYDQHLKHRKEWRNLTSTLPPNPKEQLDSPVVHVTLAQPNYKNRGQISLRKHILDK